MFLWGPGLIENGGFYGEEIELDTSFTCAQ